MKKALVISVLSSFVFGVSHAGQTTDLKTKQLSFEELKESCINPERFHAQIPPKDIKIRCEDYRTVWAPLEQKQFEMKSQRSIKTSLLSDKYHVSEQSSEVPHQAAQGSCPVYQEMNQSLSTQRKVSCEEIINHKGSLVDFCLGTIDQSLQENAQIMNQKATGRVFTTCKGQIVQQQETSLNKGFGMEQQDSQGQLQDQDLIKEDAEPIKEEVKEEVKEEEVVDQLQGQEQQGFDEKGFGMEQQDSQGQLQDQGVKEEVQEEEVKEEQQLQDQELQEELDQDQDLK